MARREDETIQASHKSSPVRLFLNGESVVVHPIDAPDWIDAGWGADPETVTGSQESGEEGLPPAGLVAPPAPAAQGAKASAGRSPAAQGVKAS